MATSTSPCREGQGLTAADYPAMNWSHNITLKRNAIPAQGGGADSESRVFASANASSKVTSEIGEYGFAKSLLW